MEREGPGIPCLLVQQKLPLPLISTGAKLGKDSAANTRDTASCHQTLLMFLTLKLQQRHSLRSEHYPLQVLPPCHLLLGTPTPHLILPDPQEVNLLALILSVVDTILHLPIHN